MRAFDSGASSKPFDAIFDKALVFQSDHTAVAWTNVFFGIIYKTKSR